MKPRWSKQRNDALTLVEVLVVIAVLAILAMIFLPAPIHSGKSPQKIQCVSNLKQLGMAYLVWSGDHANVFPMLTSVTNGGTMELADGVNVWKTFQVMSNELGTPRLLYCPTDSERDGYATNFCDGLKTRISYFVGLDADPRSPQCLTSGDDNFEIGGVPVKSGLLEFSTNTPISWTTARHNHSGNILLGDGSVQSTTSSSLRISLQETGLATNRLAIP